MPVILAHKDPAMFVTYNSNITIDDMASFSDIAQSSFGMGEDSPSAQIGQSGASDWIDPSFHGSVHTATMAVCTVLVIFVVILGTFGNGLVLLSAIRCGGGGHRHRLRSNFDLLVYNLAGADLIICFFLAPVFLYLLFAATPPAIAPQTFCGGFLFISTLCALTSLLSLVAIAAHRQSRLTGKVKGSLSVRRTAAILVGIYTVSTSAAIGGTLHVMLTWEDEQTTCQAVINSGHVTNNTLLFFVGPVVALSCVTILVCYCAIAKAVRTQTYLRVKSLQPLLQHTTTNYSRLPQSILDFGAGHKGLNCSPPHSDNSFYPELNQIIPDNLNHMKDATIPKLASQPFLQPARFQAQRSPGLCPCSFWTMWRRRSSTPPMRHCACCSCMSALDKENKAVSMCLVVILIILLCWTPLIASHIVELFTGNSIVIYQVKLCGVALVLLNSALDPYLYAQNCARHGSSFLWDVFRCECRLPRPSRTRLKNATMVSTPAPVLKQASVKKRGARGSSAGKGPLAVYPNGVGVLRGNYYIVPQKYRQPVMGPCVNPGKSQNNGFRTRPYKNNSCKCACAFPDSKFSGKVLKRGDKSRKHYKIHILKFGKEDNHLPNLPDVTCKKVGADIPRRSCAHTERKSDARTLVYKSCCHENSPEDWSLS